MTTKILDTAQAVWGKLVELKARIPRKVAIGIGAGSALLGVAVVVALAATAQPGFLAAYHTYERNADALESSLHAEVKCAQCHIDDRNAIIAGAARVGDFYRGLVNRPDEPMFVNLPKPSAEACRECHNQEWSTDIERTSSIPHPAHLRVASETRDCVECHKWTAHEEEYLERHKEMPFSVVCASFGCHVGFKSENDCSSCHHSLLEGAGATEWRVSHKTTVQESGPNGCLEACHDTGQCRMCHTTGKRPDFPEDGLSPAVKVVEQEHVKDDWMEKHGTYALEDEAKCFLCHVSAAECEDCHAERPVFHGLKTTWIGRHKDEVDDERRCLACHEKPFCEDCHDQFKEMR